MLRSEEEFLVLAAQDGDHRAFSALYQRYQKPLLRYSYKICGDAEVSQDAVQEAWIKMSKGIRRLNDPRAFRSWLYRLVRWRVIDLMRVADLSGKDQNALDEAVTEVSDEMEQDHKEALSLAIKRLPSLEKQMIHLFYLDELKISEIAEVLNIPTGTVKSRLNRARTLLKEKFDD